MGEMVRASVIYWALDYCEQDQSIDVQLNWPGVCLPEAGPRFDDTYLRDEAHVHSTRSIHGPTKPRLPAEN